MNKFWIVTSISNDCFLCSNISDLQLFIKLFQIFTKSSLVTLTWRLLASKRTLLELQQTLLKPSVAPLSDLCRSLGILIFNRRFLLSILSIKHCLVMLLHMYMLIIQLLEIFGKKPDQTSIKYHKNLSNSTRQGTLSDRCARLGQCTVASSGSVSVYLHSEMFGLCIMYLP